MTTEPTAFEEAYTAEVLRAFPQANLTQDVLTRIKADCTRWCAEGPNDQHLRPEMGARFWRLRQAGELLNFPPYNI